MKYIQKSVSLMLLTFALGAITPRAMASFYDLAYSGSGVQANLFLTATPNGGDSFTITNITGERNNVAVSGPNAFSLSDNLVYPSGGPFGPSVVLDNFGIGFAAGGIDYTVWSDGANYNEFSSDIAFTTLASLTLTPVSAVPEVNQLTLAACAVLVGGFVSFRRRKLAH
jgi:hypothetical protein